MRTRQTVEKPLTSVRPLKPPELSARREYVQSIGRGFAVIKSFSGRADALTITERRGTYRLIPSCSAQIFVNVQGTRICFSRGRPFPAHSPDTRLGIHVSFHDAIARCRTGDYGGSCSDCARVLLDYGTRRHGYRVCCPCSDEANHGNCSRGRGAPARRIRPQWDGCC